MPVVIDIKKDLRYQQGVQQGIQQGISESQRISAKKMLEKGFSISIIQEITGLSVAEISKLQNKAAA